MLLVVLGVGWMAGGCENLISISRQRLRLFSSQQSLESDAKSVVEQMESMKEKDHKVRCVVVA